MRRMKLLMMLFSSEETWINDENIAFEEKKRSKKRYVYISRRKYRLYMSRARRLVADFFSLF